MSTWLSVMCPSCRPADLKVWLDSLHSNCIEPKEIELSLTIEQDLPEYEYERWGAVKVTKVVRGQYNVNQLHEICYNQSTSPYVFMSGDDTICYSFSWDKIFKHHVEQYKDKVVLVYPNDLLFGPALACYPVVSREVMDSYPWPCPFERYAIDDTIFDMVPESRRIYLDHVVMEHLHLRDIPAGVDANKIGMPVMKGGKLQYYPQDKEAMSRDRILFQEQEPLRRSIRNKLATMAGLPSSTKVMIGIPTAEMARKGEFYDYINAMDKPVGTGMTFARGQSPAKNRNLMIDLAISNNFTHLLFLDDDVVPKKDLLYRLLAHDVDIVSGFYLMRNYPHRPIIFDYSDEAGRCRNFYPNGHSGLVEVVAAGLGACLFKVDVFKKLEEPWIRLGELQSDEWCDDIGFFKRVREAGIKIHCDLNCPVGHMGSYTVWPDKKDGKWMTTYDTNGEGIVSFPSLVGGNPNQQPTKYWPNYDIIRTNR